MDHVSITEDRIDANQVSSLVTDPSCGAISMFIGKLLALYLITEA